MRDESLKLKVGMKVGLKNCSDCVLRMPTSFSPYPVTCVELKFQNTVPEWFQVMGRQESEERLLEAEFLEGDFIIRPATRGHDGDFSELPRNTIHHFKLTKIKNKDCVSNRSYKSLQAAVPNFTIRKAIKRKEMKVQELCVKSFTKYTDILNIF